MKKIFQLVNDNISVDEMEEEQVDKKTRKKLPLITISREKGSGGRPIAYLIAEKLGKPWKVFHKEIVDDIAKQTHLEKKLIQEVDERNIPLIEEVVADFFGEHYLNLNNYYKHLVRILSTIGNRGNAVIVGRGAHYLFPQALTVRVICEMDQRIKWLMQYEKITKQEAIGRIEQSDKQRFDFEEALYTHNPNNPHHYDMVIRTGHNISIEKAADVIVLLAKERFKL